MERRLGLAAEVLTMLSMLAFWALVVVGVVALVRRFGEHGLDSSPDLEWCVGRAQKLYGPP